MGLNFTKYQKSVQWKNQPLMSLTEAAKELHYSVSGMRYLINKYHLTIYKFGGRLFVEKSQIALLKRIKYK